MSRTAILRQMQEDLQQCRNCGLCEGRTQAVLGAGVPNSRIVIVGEAPAAMRTNRASPLWDAADSFWTRCWNRWDFPGTGMCSSPIL